LIENLSLFSLFSYFTSYFQVTAWWLFGAWLLELDRYGFTTLIRSDAIPKES
jgi:hypothetical protein